MTGRTFFLPWVGILQRGLPAGSMACYTSGIITDIYMKKIARNERRVFAGGKRIDAKQSNANTQNSGICEPFLHICPFLPTASLSQVAGTIFISCCLSERQIALALCCIILPEKNDPPLRLHKPQIIRIEQPADVVRQNLIMMPNSPDVKHVRGSLLPSRR